MMKYITLTALTVCFFYGFFSALHTDTQGTITYVIDGDTIIVDDHRKIRLARIDTPEKGEQGYRQAKEWLMQYLGEDIKLDCQEERGYYDREICEVYYKSLSLNQRLLELDLAEEYNK